MSRMTQRERRSSPRGRWAVGLLAIGLGLLARDPGPRSQAAVLSPMDLVDKATLRVDLGAHHSAITAVATSADGRYVATGGLDRVVRLWDSQTGDLLRTLSPPSQDVGREGRIGALAFAPDGRHLAVAGTLSYWDAAEGRGSGVYLFDISSGRLVRRLPGIPSSSEYDYGFRLAFSGDGQRLLLLSGKSSSVRLGAARVYEQPTSPQARGVDIAQSMFADADLSVDGRVFLANTTGLTVYEKDRIVLGGGKYKSLNELSSKGVGPVLNLHSLRVSPDGNRLAISYRDHARIEIRDSRSFKLVGALELAPAGDLLPNGIVWAADGKSVLYIGNRSRRASDEAGGKSGGVLQRVLIGKTLRAVPLWQSASEITSAAQLPDGAVFFGGGDASFALLSPEGQERLQGRSNALLPSDPTELYTDETGARVWLRYGPKPKDSYGFALSQLVQDSRLQLGKPVDDSLHPPRIEVPPQYNVAGWRQQSMVTLNEASLPIRNEVPYALAVSPDQRSFVLGTSGGVRRFPFQRGVGANDCPLPARPGSDLPSPCFDTPLPARALAVNYSGDGKLIIAALSDGSIRWLRALDGQPLLSFVLHSDKRRWVLWQPQGHYVATIAGAALVGWQVNPAQVGAATLFPLERFAAKLYDPQRLMASLTPVSDSGRLGVIDLLPQGNTGGAVPPGPSQPPKLPLPRMDPAKPQESVQLRGMLPPVATILAPSDGATVSDGQVTLRVLVHSPVRQPIRGVRVLVNGRLDSKARGVVDLDGEPSAGGVSVGSSPTAAGGSSDPGGRGSGVEVYSIPVALPVGKNSIAVYAEGSAGASVPAVIHISSSAAPSASAASRPRLVVLAVGVSAYPRPDLQLNYPAKDANDLARVLRDQGSRLYGEVVVRVVTDEGASLSGIRAGFSWLTANLRSDDTALIFLAGHGVNEAGSGQYIFLPRDVDLTRLSQTGLSAGELQRVLSSLPSRALLFLDTCHSGNVLAVRRSRGLPSGDSDATSQAGDVTRFVGDLTGVEQGLVVMAASTGRQASQESPQWQNGAFTLALIEGLRGSADFRNTGRVTVNMLDLYVSERVRELTDGAQTPATAKPVTIPDFPVVTLR